MRGIRSARPATGIGHRGHLWSGTFDGCACACLAGQRSCSSRIKRWCACRIGKYGAQWQLWLAGSHLRGRVCERATQKRPSPDPGIPCATRRPYRTSVLDLAGSSPWDTDISGFRPMSSRRPTVARLFYSAGRSVPTPRPAAPHKAHPHRTPWPSRESGREGV